MSQKRRIFLSHSWEDESFAERIKAFLESIGMYVWLDNYEIIGGDSIIAKIVDAINECDFFFIVYSPKAHGSQWVRKELTWALDKWIREFRMERSFIIPIFRCDTEFWQGIRDLHYLDFREDDEFDRRCEDLKNAVMRPESSDLFAKQRAFVPATTSVRTHKDSLHKRLALTLSRYVRRPILSEADRQYSFITRPSERVLDLPSLVRREAHILLNGDAGIGKTIELDHLAFELSSAETVLVPVFGSLNQFVDEQLEEYLPIIKQFPDETVVLILDGFDEVQAVHKSTLIRRIEHFSLQHPLCHIVLSTRTNLSQHVSGFHNYYMVELSPDDCIEYARKELGPAAKRFQEELGRKEYWSLIRHPFYLFLLVEIFRKLRSIPSNRSEVIEHFLQAQLEGDINKYRTAIPAIEAKRPVFRNELERFAMIAETLGRNFVTDAELERIIPQAELRAEVCGLSILKKGVDGDTVWQFEHNNFQEYLAALVLSRQELTTIQSSLTFDPAHQAFKPSWSNTTGFLLNVLSTDRAKFDAVVSWLNSIAPEVLIKAEPDRIPTDFRLGIFRKIFEDFSSKRIHIARNLYSTKELGQFADSRQAVQYLIDVLERERDEDVLDNAVELLRFMTLQPSLRERIRTLLIELVDERNGSHLICTTLLTLAELHLNDGPTSAYVVCAIGGSDNTWIRFSLYYYLYTSDVLDDYVDVFLKGIPFIRMSIGSPTESGETRLGDESFHLQEGLRRISRPDALRKLISYFIHETETFQLVHLTEDMPAITHHIELAHKCDPSLYELMVDFYVKLTESYQIEESKIILRFFDSTGTRAALFQRLFSARAIKKDWYSLVAPVLNEELADAVAKAFVAGEITEIDVWVLRNFIPREMGGSVDWYLEVINRRTGNRFMPPPVRDYEADRKARVEADYLLLFNRDAFIKGIKRIFDTERKSQLSQSDVRDIRVSRWEEHYYSDLAIRELEGTLASGPKTFEQVVATILTFDWGMFVASKLYERMEHATDVHLSAEHIASVKAWYDEHIRQVDFKEVLKPRTRESGTASHLAVILWFFTRRFQFACPPDVLLDMLSFDWIENFEMAGIGFIEDRLDDWAIAPRVIQNLANGITNASVLKNHLNFCKRHKIEDVVQFCPAIVRDLEWSNDVRLEALGALDAFESGKPIIRDLLMGIEVAFAWCALEKHKESESDIVSKRLLQIMLDSNSDNRRKAAMMLVRMGNLDALKTLTSIVAQEMCAPGGLDERDLFNNIMVPDALHLFVDLLELSYDPKFKDNSFYSIRNSLLSALRTIAIAHGKLEEVGHEIAELIRRKQAQNDSVRYLHVFIAELGRDARINQSLSLDLDSVIDVVDKNLRRA
jgi:TIR domain